MKTIVERSDFEGKKIAELVESGLLPSRLNDIPSIGFEGRDEFEKRIRLTDTYAKYFSKYTSYALTGTEKQIIWANKIRAKSVDSRVFELIVNILLNRIGASDLDVDAWWKRKSEEINATNAAWWIDNRFNF